MHPAAAAVVLRLVSKVDYCSHISELKCTAIKARNLPCDCTAELFQSLVIP
jgi:hypothetical protein